MTVDLMSGKEVPKDLSGIPGLCTGFRPKVLNTSKLVIAGLPGTGKSTLLHSNPHALVLDPEDGGRTAGIPEAIRYPDWEAVTRPPSLEDYLNTARNVIRLKSQGKLDSVQMIGIDTFDRLLELWDRDFCKRHSVESPGDACGGYGKGYLALKREIMSFLSEISHVGLGWCLLVHITDQIVRSGTTDRVMLKLTITGKMREIVFQESEHMLFMDSDVDRQEHFKPNPKGGSPVSLGVTEKRIRKIVCEPGELKMGGQITDVKVRVPFPRELIVPQRGGWAVFDQAFNDAVSIVGKTNG